MILVFFSPPEPPKARTLTLTRTTMLAAVPTPRHIATTETIFGDNIFLFSEEAI